MVALTRHAGAKTTVAMTNVRRGGSFCVRQYPAEIPHGIMFHHFHGTQYLRVQGSISQKEFERILQCVGIERIITPAEWLEKLDANELNPHEVCLTFDDGLLCQFEIALSVLERYGLRAFWFVYSSVFEGHVEKMEIYRAFRSTFFKNIEEFYAVFFRKVFNSPWSTAAWAALDQTEIRLLRNQFPFYSVNDVKFRLIRDRVLARETYEGIMDEIMAQYGAEAFELSRTLWMSDTHLKYLAVAGHVIGLHSYSHPTTIAALAYEKQLEEYTRNYAHVKRVCGRDPVAVAHPCNSYNDDTIRVLNELGVRCGFRADMLRSEEAGKVDDHRLEMRREDHTNIVRMLGGEEQS